MKSKKPSNKANSFKKDMGMTYINEQLLNEHLNIIKEIDQMIEDSEGELYKLIVHHPEHIYKIFGGGYHTLTSIWSLLHSLRHWIEDDGDYCIIRKVNERMSNINKIYGRDGEDVILYAYSIQAGYGRDEDESCYTTVEDMVYLFNAAIKASDFYESNKDCIEGFVDSGRESFIERRKKPCYQEWRMLVDKADKYLEKKFNERWQDD